MAPRQSHGSRHSPLVRSAASRSDLSKPFIRVNLNASLNSSSCLSPYGRLWLSIPCLADHLRLPRSSGRSILPQSGRRSRTDSSVLICVNPWLKIPWPGFPGSRPFALGYASRCLRCASAVAKKSAAIPPIIPKRHRHLPRPSLLLLLSSDL